MSILLGNIQFDEVREKLGYQLTEQDRAVWDKYHNNSADLSGMDSSFHVFDIPRAIYFRGDEAKNALLSMFSCDKLVEPKGQIGVFSR